MRLLKSLFKGRAHSKSVAIRLNDAIMAQALKPDFFGDDLVQDTFSGRFEIVSLHAALVLRRLRELGDEGTGLAQETFDALFSGFDDALREVGTGDLRVGKKIRKIGEAFYGRAKAYDEALAESADDDALAQAVERNIGLQPNSAQQLAEYARRASALLSTQSGDKLLTGELIWPAIAPPSA